ncbi:MAG TPA: molybdopterin-dependent oxidoreductase [Chloroflexota bacterium]
MRPPSWSESFLVGTIATAIALRLQSVLRDVWQIRGLPERVMEWLLLFVPLDLFERGLQQFGSSAKEVALLGTLLGMALLLLALGVLALRAGWSSWRLLGLGCVLWLLAMVVVMPLTGAGVFARNLLIAPLLVNAGYLFVFLAYASMLAAGRLLIRRGPMERARVAAERRAVLAGVVGTLGALGVARFVGREGVAVVSSLPLAAPRTPRPTGAPTSTPTSSAVAVSATAGPTGVPTLSPVQSAETPAALALPVPPAERPLVRNKDGALTAAGRPPGTLAPALTANMDFYVVTKNAVADPVVDPAGWRLIVDGEVNNPVQFDYRTLRMLNSIEVIKTLECISNFTAQCNLAAFGCDLISTARWRGVRLSDVLDLAGGLRTTATTLAFLSIDEFSAGLPVDVVDDPETLIVYEMNGEPLPREHGYPARLLVPGRYGMKNPKWLTAIRALSTDFLGWYEQRNWNKDGFIKTMARIDVPGDGTVLLDGPQRVAGIAYAGDRGIETVEFSVDGGKSWDEASFVEPAAGKDAMVRWEGSFNLAPQSSLTIVVRATDGNGDVQSSQFVLPQPDGASGRHAVTVYAA